MAHSQADRPSFTCPQCGSAFAPELWLIIDAAERPDLLARVRDGTIHHVVCPNGHLRSLQVPLLILWLEMMLVSLSERAVYEEDRDAEVAWLHQLGKRASIDWQQDAQVDRIRFVERSKLPDLIDRLSSNLHTLLETDWLAHYRRTGSIASLDKAIAIREAALRSIPAEPAQHAAHMHYLGVAYHERYTRLRQRADLVRAGINCAVAVELTPGDAPTRATRLLDLGLVTRERHHISHSLDDLDEAISTLEEAQRLSTEPVGGRAMIVHNLASCYSDYYKHTGELAYLERAIILQRQTLDSESDPKRPLSLYNLSNNLHRRYERLGESEDRDEALALAREAAQAQTSPPEYVLLATCTWATLALGQQLWDEVLAAVALIRKTLQGLDEANPLVQERLSWRRGVQGLAATEAYALARRGDLRAAVVALEASQAMQLNANLPRGRDRTLLAQLATDDPSLYADFRAAAEAHWLAQHNGLDILNPWSRVPDDLADIRTRATAAQAALDEVVGRVNAIPGYEVLFTPVNFNDVAAAVDQEPLVYLVTTVAGSLMLLLYRTGAEVVVEPVWTALSAGELERLLIRREYAAGNVGPIIGGLWPAQERGGMMRELEVALPAVHVRLMAPLATRLRELGAATVTLIPGGKLALLPLHAAHPQGALSTTFLDEFAVAYAPSAQAVTHCRAASDIWLSTPLVARPALVVGDPMPVSRPLPHARAEAEAVAARLGTTPLVAEAATRQAVWEALWGKGLIHFASHGIFDPDRPHASGLVLADDHRLTLQDIRDAAILANGPLVVLSACQTSLTDTFQLPDEVLGLPGGLLGAGAAGVVATLWPLDDPAGRLLIERFYTGLLDEGLPPAEALRTAQRHLRSLPRQAISDYFKTRIELGESGAEVAHSRLPAGSADSRIYTHPYYWAVYTFTGAAR